MFERLQRRYFILFELFNVRSVKEFVQFIDDYPLSDQERLRKDIDKIIFACVDDSTSPNNHILISFGCNIILKSLNSLNSHESRHFFKYILSYIASSHNNVKILTDEKFDFKRAYNCIMSSVNEISYIRAELSAIRNLLKMDEETTIVFEKGFKEYQEGKRLVDIVMAEEKDIFFNCPLENLRKIGYSSDCFINVISTAGESKSYSCHRLIMASFSNLLRTQFENEDKFRSEGGNKFSIAISNKEFELMDFFLSLPYYGVHLFPFSLSKEDLFTIFGGNSDENIAIFFKLCDYFMVVDNVYNMALKYISFLELPNQFQILSSVPHLTNEKIKYVASFSTLTKTEFMDKIESFEGMDDDRLSSIAFKYCSALSKDAKPSKTVRAPVINNDPLNIGSIINDPNIMNMLSGFLTPMMRQPYTNPNNAIPNDDNYVLHVQNNENP